MSLREHSANSPLEGLSVQEIQARAGALFELGVTPGADDATIRNAFRQRLKETHPDLTGGTDTLLRRIIYARDLLMSENRRSAEKAQWLKDFAKSHRDPDGALLLNLTLEQAIYGGEVIQSVPALEVSAAHEPLTSLTQMKTLKITLPAGLREGEKLRLHTEGAARSEQLFRIHISTGHACRVSGDDIWMSAEVESRVLFSGGKAIIQTPHGPREIDIPRGFSYGHSLCVPALGMPATAKRPCGDLHIRLDACANSERPFDEAINEFRQRWAS